MLGLEVTRRILEALFRKHQQAIQFIVAQLHLRNAALVDVLHARIALVFDRDDLLLEDHDDGGIAEPAQQADKSQRDRDLEGWTEFEKRHRTAASQVELPMREIPVQERKQTGHG